MTKKMYDQLFPESSPMEITEEGTSKARRLSNPNHHLLNTSSLISLNKNELPSKDIPIFALQKGYLNNVNQLNTKDNAFLVWNNSCIGVNVTKKTFAPIVKGIDFYIAKNSVVIGGSKDITSPATFMMGKYYVEDADTKEILFIGVIDKSCVNLDNITNYKELLNQPLILQNNRDLPLVRFYMSINVLSHPKYKAIYQYLASIIAELSEAECEIIITSNIRGKFEKIYKFPQFKEFDQMDIFITNCFTNIVKRTAESKKTEIKLTQLQL